MLIYLLDLTAVIYISGILIHEKFIAIDFAHKEVQGNAYAAPVRDTLLDLARFGTGDVSAQTLLQHVPALSSTNRDWGEGLGSGALTDSLVSAVQATAAAAPASAAGAINVALGRGRNLMTRVGNQSNLILDPDLDTYYTMSQVVLRYPELLQLVQDLGDVPSDSTDTSTASEQNIRTRFLILEGRLDAAAQGTASDNSEALAAGDSTLTQRLVPLQRRLVTAIEAFRNASRRMHESNPAASSRVEARAAQRALIEQLQAIWVASSAELDRMLNLRIATQYQRMWFHLGTALTLLIAILGLVTFVARQIARPLRHLSNVADAVRHTGDHTIRAEWQSEDEIGRLVVAFNEMLAQLDRERETQKELVASASAAQAERALVEATPIPLVVTAIPGHQVLHANLPAQAWLHGRRSDPWKSGLESSVRARFFQQLQDRGAVDEFEVHWRGDGEPAWAVLSARRMQYQGHDALLTAFAPINHLKLMERRLELWAKVFEASGEGILIVDMDQRILTANRAYRRHTSHELQDVVGQRASSVFSHGQLPGLPQELWETVTSKGTWQGELTMQRHNGTVYPAWLMVSAVRQSQGDMSHFIFSTIDITDRKKSEQRIRFLADHDVLTELPNRSLCIERLRMAIQQAQRTGQKVAVLFIDLDRFKDINDSLGHHIGDGLLRSVAARLNEGVRAGDTVSRLGGDEFVIVLNGVQDSDEVAHIVEERLIPQIRRSHTVDRAELNVSCSVGIALYPDDALSIDELMRHADTAMYQAKAEGKDRAQFFTAEMTWRARTRMELEAKLRQAIGTDQFFLLWQPKVNATTGAMVGAEGLLRWRHPELGVVSPAHFIPLAEETGLIVPIGNWVIEEACRQIRLWRMDGFEAGKVSINVSARQLHEANLVETVRAAMDRQGVGSGMLELELTESIVMDDAEGNLQQMHALRALGVGLSIDDFGTGYSSLAYLNRFPIDTLKIDRSFVHDMLTDATDRAVIMAIIGLGHTLKLQVVAEGVERDGEAILLREGGCDELQGFLIARPMPAQEVKHWAAQRDHATQVAEV